MHGFTLQYNVRESAPTLARFHRSNHPFRIICGPIGGGKSVACCVEIYRRCVEQRKGPDGLRRSRWVVVRNTRGQLKDTTLKTWFDWFPSGSGIGYWKETESTFFLEFGDVKAEILFRALDTPADIAKVLSLELTGAWLNECREIPQEIVESLQGRLERYPSQKMGGSDYWMMIADTNPPELDSYWWKLLEHVPLDPDDEDTLVDCDTFKQPSGIAPNAENTQNLEPGYYTRKAKGRSKAWIDVYIKAQYSVSQAGRPVYHRVFKKDRHVSTTPLKADPYLPVIVGFDCGLTPAALFMQLTLDGRLLVLREAVEFDMGMKRFARTRLRPIVKNFFSSNSLVFIGDPAGKRRADSDESSAFKALKLEFDDDIERTVVVRGARTNDPEVRIQATENALSQFPAGDPLMLIDPSCKWYIGGLQTKYFFPKQKLTGEHSLSPKKNEWSHIVEAGQYGQLFLLSDRYDASDFMHPVGEGPFRALQNQRPYRPAQAEGY